tara:strand:+ start:573 stop:2525 length:1953 start_codon:yes stop_codon:yes gene_type:complete
MATKKVNIDIVARDKSQQALNKVRGNLDGVKKAVFNVRNALAGLGAGLVIRNLVNTGKEIESLQVRLKFLFGTAEEGAKAFDNMAKFAAKVPFSLEQIQQGAGVLSVVSKDADELSDILEITGNVAAVTGLDFRTASEQIQRSLSAGIASADLFREKGVRDLLGFKAGATVTAEETAEAFERVFGKGGKFGGATNELAKTLDGTLSMIGDKIFTFKKTLLDAGFFAELKKQFGDLDNFLQENAETLDEVATSIGKGLAQAVLATGKAVIFLKNNFDAVIIVLKSLIALKVASIFVGIATAIKTATAATLLFNKALRKNLLIGGAAIVIANLREILGLTKQIMGITDDKALDLVVKVNVDEPVDRHPEKIITDRTQEELKKQQKIYEEHAHFRGILANRQAAEEVKQELIKSENINAILEQNKQDGIAIFHEMQRQKERIINESKILEINNENEKAKELREINKNNFHKMLDDASEFHSKKAELEKQAKEHAISEGRSALEILSGMNKTAFAAFKAVRIAEATIDTYRAATAAFAKFGGFPLGALAAAASVAKGLALVAQIKSTNFRQGGGSVNKNQAYMVGETGPEMFVPSGSGKIVPNNKVGNSQPVTVNFNINTVDARGFNELLVNSRGVIINMINSAVNEKGRMAIV